MVNGMLRSGARKLSSKKCCKECGAPPVLPGKIEVDVAMKFLRYKGSDRGYVDRHEFSGPNGGPIETKDTGVVLLPALAKPVRPEDKPKAKPKAKAKPKKKGKVDTLPTPAMAYMAKKSLIAIAFAWNVSVDCQRDHEYTNR